MQIDDIINYQNLIKQNEYDIVIQELETRKKEDNDIRIIQLLIRAYRDSGQAKKVEELLNSSNKNKIDLMMLEADYELDNNNIDACEKILKRVINTTKSIDAYLKLGNIEEQKGNIEKAKSYYQFVLFQEEEHPYALNGLARLELRNKNYDEAEQIFKNILNVSEKMIQEENPKKLKIEKVALKGLIYLELKRENYETAYEYFKRLKKNKYTSYNEIRREEIILKNKLNILDSKTVNSDDLLYFEKQVLNYDENLTFSHLVLHRKTFDNKRTHAVFNHDLNIKELYQEVKELIGNKEPTLFNFSDIYILDMGRTIGTTNQTETNKLKVITLINTKNILSMYPCSPHFEAYKEQTINEDCTNYQRKRKSQIDKFNQRYNKNF